MALDICVRVNLLHFLYLCIVLVLAPVQAVTFPAGYNTIWTTQSDDSSGSMPVGGGDVGLNVWAEKGDILFYIAKSGAFDENNSLLKLGRVRLQMKPNPFATNSTLFKQQLHVYDGHITLNGDYQTTLNLWVDMDSSAIHVSVNSSVQMVTTASLESWRTHGYTLTPPQQQQTSWGINAVDTIPAPYQYPDTVKFTDGGILSYHANKEQPLFDFQVKDQGIKDPESYYNPMRDNTFGVFMYSPDFRPGNTSTGRYLSTDYTAFPIVTTNKSTSFNLVIGTSQAQSTQTETWITDLIIQTKQNFAVSQAKTLNWWHTFWDRSWIIINPTASPSDPGFQVGKNYQYFRYMMACNAKGTFPTRFNGGLFTFDPILTDTKANFTPDYRRWSGGTFTAQNQRLLYWPLLKTGDVDMLEQTFNFYGNMSVNNRKLGQLYFGLDVALTSEQIDNTGLPNAYEYNANVHDNKTRTALYPPGILFNDWLAWQQDTANEFASMVIQARSVYGTDVQKWMPFVEHQLAWFDEFYRKRNGLTLAGKLIIYPASGAETYKFARDPSSTVSGLRRIILDMLDSGVEFVKGNKTYYEEFLKRVPETPLHHCPGKPELTCVAPATNYSFTKNNEPSALYTVYPWGEYGLGQPTNLTFAYNAYFFDNDSSTFHGNNGWRQDQIFHARMGLTHLAMNNTIDRFSDSTQYRFSAFKGPNYDWSPDLNHYGSAAIGLQEMLMQTFAKNNSQIRLLPAWPSNWTGSFKLLAPGKTTVSGDIVGTGIEKLAVKPESRMKDVVFRQN